ncbi:MAG: pseudouridine synthase [Treponema sp.]|nr:pseudouridine synthase [Treponema sp.]
MEISFINESKENPFLVIYKPAGLPSAPLSADDENNALFKAQQKHPEIKNVLGRKPIEYGLLHRIDTDTAGLLLIATTQAFYDYMLKQQLLGNFLKYYKAECILDTNNAIKLQGFPDFPNEEHKKLLKNANVSVTTYFRYFGKGSKEVRPVILTTAGKSAKNKIGKMIPYTTEVKLISSKPDKNYFQFECKIAAGFKHQVRSHLCFLGFPIINDKVYNYNSKEKALVESNNLEEMKFTAYKIQFEYNNQHYCFMI